MDIIGFMFGLVLFLFLFLVAAGLLAVGVLGVKYFLQILRPINGTGNIDKVN